MNLRQISTNWFISRSAGGAIMTALLLTVVLCAFYFEAYFSGSSEYLLHVAVMILLIMAGWKLAKEGAVWKVARLDIVLASIVGAMLGHILLTRLHVPPVLAGSVCGLLVGLLCQFNIRVFIPYSAPLYAGVFAGTGSPLILHGAPWVLFAGLLTGLFWSMLMEFWSGVGGKLGFVGMSAALLSLWCSELFFGMAAPDLPMEPFNWELLIVVPVAGLFALLTRILFREYRWNVILASALPTFVAACSLYFSASLFWKPLSVAAFGGGFVGMTNPVRLTSNSSIVFAGALFGLIVIGMQSPLVGCGGVLGATACSAVMAVIGCQTNWSRIQRMFTSK